MTNRKTYLLVDDDDGHWYLIPEEGKTEFDAWLSAVYDEDYDSPLYEKPEFVKEIDCPQSILIHAFSYACN